MAQRHGIWLRGWVCGLGLALTVGCGAEAGAPGPADTQAGTGAGKDVPWAGGPAYDALASGPCGAVPSCRDGVLVSAIAGTAGTLPTCPEAACGEGESAGLCAGDAAAVTAPWVAEATERRGTLVWPVGGPVYALQLLDEDGAVRLEVPVTAEAFQLPDQPAPTVRIYDVAGDGVTLDLGPDAGFYRVMTFGLHVGAPIAAPNAPDECTWRVIAGHALFRLGAAGTVGLAWAPAGDTPWSHGEGAVPVRWWLRQLSAPPPEPPDADCHTDCSRAVSCEEAFWVWPPVSGLVVWGHGAVPCWVADDYGWSWMAEICSAGAPPAIPCVAECARGAPLCADDAVTLASQWPDGGDVAPGRLRFPFGAPEPGQPVTLQLETDQSEPVLDLRNWYRCEGEPLGPSGVVRQRTLQPGEVIVAVEGAAKEVESATLTWACFEHGDRFLYPEGMLAARLADARTVRVAWRPRSLRRWVWSADEARSVPVEWTLAIE